MKASLAQARMAQAAEKQLDEVEAIRTRLIAQDAKIDALSAQVSALLARTDKLLAALTPAGKAGKGAQNEG